MVAGIFFTEKQDNSDSLWRLTFINEWGRVLDVFIFDIGENKKTSQTYGLTDSIEQVAGNMKHLEQRFVVLRNALSFYGK